MREQQVQELLYYFFFFNEVQPSSILHDNSPRMHRVNRLLYLVLQQV